MATPLLFLALLLHPFHFTNAEVEWNPKTARVEVALRVNGSDLEQEIHRDTGRKIAIRKQMDASDQQWLAQYIGQRLYVATSAEVQPDDAATSRLKWIGVEDDSGWTWLYFELIPPVKPQQLWLTNRLFLEMHPTHVNYVSFLSAGKRQTLRCSREHPSIRCPLEVDPPRE